MGEVRLGHGEGAGEVVLGGAAAHEDVLADGGGEEGGFLEGHGHPGAQFVPGHPGDVRAVEGDVAFGDLVEAGTRAVRVVLPLPVAPTRARDSPGRMWRSMRSRTGGESAGASG
ncbi:hypothetical protein SHKM778_18180 [Streptomyces sp. KM77-8]|uniref:Uncharacterized protein n=1 Tax=Streptomyces haneummycinicus TaxID=3074435 RepID=A0AAT9HDH7_9ACTN